MWWCAIAVCRLSSGRLCFDWPDPSTMFDATLTRKMRRYKVHVSSQFTDQMFLGKVYQCAGKYDVGRTYLMLVPVSPSGDSGICCWFYCRSSIIRCRFGRKGCGCWLVQRLLQYFILTTRSIQLEPTSAPVPVKAIGTLVARADQQLKTAKICARWTIDIRQRSYAYVRQRNIDTQH